MTLAVGETVDMTKAMKMTSAEGSNVDNGGGSDIDVNCGRN